MQWRIPFLVALGWLFVACSASSPQQMDDSGITDASIGNEGSVKDRVGPPSDGSGCMPKNLASWMPPAFVPPVPQQNACTGTQIQKFYDSCIGPQSTANACQYWISLNKKCDACLESTDGAMASGAIIYTSDGYRPNASGCIATLGYLDCAKRASALWACKDAACRDNCPAGDDAGNAELDACRTAAAGSVCKVYGDEVDTTCPAPLGKGEGSSVAFCLQSDLQAFYMAFAPVLCGAGG